MKKRVLSALLVLCMACGLVSTAWATAPETTEQPGNVTVSEETNAPTEEPTGTTVPETQDQPANVAPAADENGKTPQDEGGSTQPAGGTTTEPGVEGTPQNETGRTNGDATEGGTQPESTQTADPADPTDENGAAGQSNALPAPVVTLGNGGGMPSTQADLEPDQNYISVSKRFEGLPEEKIPDGLQITVTANGNNNISYTLTEDDTEHDFQSTTTEDGDIVWTWMIQGVSEGDYTVTEIGEEIAGYEIETSGIGDSIEIKMPDVTVSQEGETLTSCSEQEFKVGEQGTKNFLFVVRDNGGKNIAVISKQPLPASVRKAIEEVTLHNIWSSFKPANASDIVKYYSVGDSETEQTFTIGGTNFTYSPESGKVTIGATSQWSQAAILSYDIADAINGDINITNTYTSSTTTLTLEKTFDGLSDAEVEYLIFRNDGFGFDVNYCVPKARNDQEKNKLTFMATDDDVEGWYLPNGTEVSSLNNGGGGYRIEAKDYLDQNDWHTSTGYKSDYTNSKTGASLTKKDGNWTFSITLDVPVCKDGYFFTVFEQHQEVPGYAKINDSNAEWTITAEGQGTVTGTGKFVDGETDQNVYEDMGELGTNDKYREQEDFAIAQGALRKLHITSDTTIAFTNHYTGRLDVTKTVTADEGNTEAASKIFTLTLEPADLDKLTASDNLSGKTVHYTVDNDTQVMRAEIENGKITVRVIPGDNKTVTLHFTDLPAIQWKVVEDENAAQIEGYNLEVKYMDDNNLVVNNPLHWNGYGEGETIGANATDDKIASVDSAGTCASVTVTNTYTRNTGNLTITKEVNGMTLPENGEEFTFTISTSDAEMEGATPKIGDKDITFTKPDGSNTYTSIPVTITAKTKKDGVDGSVTITGLPLGTYTVTENAPADIGDGDYYCSGTTYKVEGTDTNPSATPVGAQLTAEASDKTVAVTNTYAPYKSVVLSKTVNGTGAVDGDKFTFTITGITTDQIPTDEDDKITIGTDDDDNVTVTMTGGQSVTIKYLKADDEITITETEPGNGYTPSVDLSGVDGYVAPAVGDDGETTPAQHAGFTMNVTNAVTVDVDSVDEAGNDNSLGEIEFINTRNIPTPTGLESNHTAPYTLMITAAGIAGLALIGAVVNRRIRRRREE